MCNITYLPAGVPVPEREIMNAATWNDDGHGWAVAAELGVMLTGRYMDSETALETFKATRRAFPNVPAMFHSRYATHGTVGLSNVHPFTVGKFAAVAHNGILPTKFQPQKGNHMSDTAIMARYWLAGRAQVSGIWTRKERKRIARIIGAGNKLAILSVSPFLPEPRGYLVNGHAGNWDTKTGAWFSSRDYLYAWSKGRGYGSWLWDGDEWAGGSTGETVVGKVNVSELERCPNCKHSSQLDLVSGVCLHCDFCLDCLSFLRECMCYYGNTETSQILTAEEAAEQGEVIEVQISELGGQS